MAGFGILKLLSSMFFHTIVIAVFNQYYFITQLKRIRPKVFCKKGVLRNLGKLTGKHLCQSLFFKKVTGLATFLKMRLWHRCFPVIFLKFLRTTFLTQQLQWLLLPIVFIQISVLPKEMFIYCLLVYTEAATRIIL